MNHDVLKTVIYDQHELIRNYKINERFYSLEKSANYILIGLRRSGKSLMLYKLAQQLINEGVDDFNIKEREVIEDFCLLLALDQLLKSVIAKVVVAG